MAEYQDLGPREATGVADPNNRVAAGNWTVTFTPTVLGVTVPLFELYHVGVAGPGGGIIVYRNDDMWDAVNVGGLNGWDPAQPMLVRPGDTIYFYWNISSGAAPVVTIWLRASTGL